MTTFITPRILYVCYVISVVVIVFVACAFEVALFTARIYEPSDRNVMFLLGVFVVPIVAIVLVIAARISTELVLVVFRIEEHLRDMRDARRTPATEPSRSVFHEPPGPPAPRTVRPRIEPRF